MERQVRHSSQVDDLDKRFDSVSFVPADVLIPKGCDLSLWSVVACDQYTSQPEYWERVGRRVGDAPSTLKLILPETRLEGPDVQSEIAEINQTMNQYLDQQLFAVVPDSMVYVERRLHNGDLRRGLVGMVDLEQYDYLPGSDAKIRATEGTVLERIPPRVEVRKDAAIELPHVMVLCDDPERTVIEPLGDQKSQMNPVYDFELMENGGHISGWALDDAQLGQVAEALEGLADPSVFAERYNAPGKPVMVFAVGDGNHSLATAKECYEQQKKATGPQEWDSLPSRYALCELVNLHDDSLEFEPIHRVVFGVDPQQLIADIKGAFPGERQDEVPPHVFSYSFGGHDGELTVSKPSQQLEVGTLQTFLDGWVLEHPEARLDYIHGEDVARGLAEQPNAVAFLLPGMAKDSLFPTVIHDGVLPRKTFSMGEAHDKRFYLEARKIR